MSACSSRRSLRDLQHAADSQAFKEAAAQDAWNTPRGLTSRDFSQELSKSLWPANDARNMHKQGVTHLIAFCHNDECRLQALIDALKYPGGNGSSAVSVDAI
jgi:hypothetical protein